MNSMAAWNQNPYQNAYGVPGYNPAPNFMSQNYTPVPQQQPNYINAPVQPQQGIQGQSMVLQGRMVTSREEALGIPADFSGNPIFMPCLSEGKIYCKKFNMNTGASDFAEFRLYNPQPQLESPAQEHHPAPSFASLDDLKSLQDEINSLKQKIEELENPVQSTTETATSSKGGKK